MKKNVTKQNDHDMALDKKRGRNTVKLQNKLSSVKADFFFVNSIHHLKLRKYKGNVYKHYI